MAEPARMENRKKRRETRIANRRRQNLRPLEEWVSWGGVAVFLAVLSLVVLYALLLTHIRGEVVQLGYDIRNLAQQADALSLEVKESQLHRQELRSPERLEELARRLQLRKPGSEQMVVINDR